ncbi:hypothetical protein F4778DRAFT_499937 [Xylariomycetidae sp. FL2044]|nr:hypothetical protein F4778DRAFT_499937 [Xylariomycetidae sp. FL2044]
MAYQRHIARMTLRHIEQGDSFPERHVTDFGGLTLESEDESDYILEDAKKPRHLTSTRPTRSKSQSPKRHDTRCRYWEVCETLKRDLKDPKEPPGTWNRHPDSLGLRTSRLPESSVISRLEALPVRRVWKRRGPMEVPARSLQRTAEAITIYERGDILTAADRCDRCRRGNTASPECVVVPHVAGNACSNCLYEGMAWRCSLSCLPEHLWGASPERHKHRETSSFRGEDLRPVLDLIEQLQRVDRRDNTDLDIPQIARRIEQAALHIAEAAREWGRRGGPET